VSFKHIIVEAIVGSYTTRLVKILTLMTLGDSDATPATYKNHFSLLNLRELVTE
jgi:hypothetical protein